MPLKFTAEVPRSDWMRFLRAIHTDCWKCLDGRTARHHRRCLKRGNREQANEALKRWMLERAIRAAAMDAKREAQMTAIERLFATTLPPGVTLSYERSSRAPSRTRRFINGMGGVMADAAGRAAAETQAHAERLVRDSFLDTASPEWLEALYDVRRAEATPATLEVGSAAQTHQEQIAWANEQMRVELWQAPTPCVTIEVDGEVPAFVKEQLAEAEAEIARAILGPEER